MTKSPVINAISASAYILLVVTVMNTATQYVRSKPDTFFAPVAFLSIFTLSVTVMAYLFFYQPVMLFIAGKKKDATQLFIKTLSAFAVITVIVVALVFTGVI